MAATIRSLILHPHKSEVSPSVFHTYHTTYTPMEDPWHPLVCLLPNTRTKERKCVEFPFTVLSPSFRLERSHKQIHKMWKCHLFINAPLGTVSFYECKREEKVHSPSKAFGTGPMTTTRKICNHLNKEPHGTI